MDGAVLFSRPGLILGSTVSTRSKKAGKVRMKYNHIFERIIV